MKNNKKIIIGIDPGLLNTGWGVIEKNGNSLKFIDCGTIKTKSKEPLSIRLGKIFSEIDLIIKKYNPIIAGIEDMYINNNPQTSIKLSMAKASSIVACSVNKLNVKEFSPTSVKKATVGVGRAGKDQIFSMVKILLSGLDTEKIDSEHSADALAIAITCSNNMIVKF